MPEKEVCMHHSGLEARIVTCENNDKDIFSRLRDLEKTVWQAAGASGIIYGIVTAIVVSVISKGVGH